MADDTKPAYGAMLREVKQIVEQLSADTVDVDDMAQKVERGFTMINAMKERLNETKEKIDDLYEKFEQLGETGASPSDDS